MDVRFINPVLSSISNVLSTMAQMETRAGKPSVKTDTRALGPVSSTMEMVSDKTRGTLAITFSDAVIKDIAKRMLGEDIEEMGDTAESLTGEITNMVVGGAKNSLAELGYDFNMSTPDVVSGSEYVIEHKYGQQIILLPFSVDSGEFYIELCFENTHWE